MIQRYALHFFAQNKHTKLFKPTMRFPGFLLMLLSCSFVSAQKLYYVNQNATGAQTGDTWANAFSDLQTALALVSAGDTVWVAAGTYKPTASATRTASFNLVDGVQLYGGFSGVETELVQRDIEQYKTILSGDIGAAGVYTDNSYHVVRGKGV